jgi:hypothetical protein
MLIEHVAAAPGAVFIQHAFGFSSAEPGAIGFGLLCRQFSFSALSKSLQVN